MPADREILLRAASLASEGARFVLCTVVGAQGRTPRNMGARMIVFPDGRIEGSIGGGGVELLATEAATVRIKSRDTGVEKFVLSEEAGQCCGGVMEVYFECHGFEHRCVLFGAGHVAEALVPMLTPSSLDVIVVDHRSEWNNAERYPSARRVMSYEEGVSLAIERTESTIACVLTCSHDTDLDILVGLLQSPPAFVGLIGSSSKRAGFAGRLTARGIAENDIARIHCPIGLGDMGKEPTLVAVSIAGQVLLEAKKLARG